MDFNSTAIMIERVKQCLYKANNYQNNALLSLF